MRRYIAALTEDLLDRPTNILIRETKASDVRYSRSNIGKQPLFPEQYAAYVYSYFITGSNIGDKYDHVIRRGDQSRRQEIKVNWGSNVY